MPDPTPQIRAEARRAPVGTTGRSPFARFDDLRAGRALVFSRPRHELVAERAEDVAEILVEVERASENGSWAVGFLSYEAAAGLDPKLHVRSPRPSEALGELPCAWFALFDEPSRERPLAPTPPCQSRGTYEVTPWTPDMDFHVYARRVDAVHAAIEEGETYQCNLTVRYRATATGNLSELYRDLALRQHGAYGAEIETGRYAVLSASPELFFEWAGGRITARPMKGTAPRGRTPVEDEALGRALAASEKDRAENVMIVDLVRNDLGRVADWGSVEVTSLFDLERYPTVWQLTSTVTAVARYGTRLADIFGALFPCGSVTGAPKQRTMELIASLESSTRGVYCGALGYVAPADGDVRARFSVPIRTLVVDRLTNEAVYGTGGAITWYSDAAAEHAELVAKSAILPAAPG